MKDLLLEGALTLLLVYGWLDFLLFHLPGETEKSGDSSQPAGGNREDEPPQGKGGGWAV